jgi:inhibitor of cysteine peptidase
MRTRTSFPVSSSAVVLILILALAAFAAAGCGESAEANDGPLTLTETDNGKSFTVEVGDTILVVLPGNPTTGYSWAAALDEESAALLTQEGEPLYAEDAVEDDVVGGGGAFTFTFTAAKEGAAAIKLVYARPWESEAPLETFEATITVE